MVVVSPSASVRTPRAPNVSPLTKHSKRSKIEHVLVIGLSDPRIDREQRSSFTKSSRNHSVVTSSGTPHAHVPAVASDELRASITYLVPNRVRAALCAVFQKGFL